MAHGFKHGRSGGSTNLNFKVIGSTTEPSNPEENMIWVSTDQGITSYSFSATEPENPIYGMVWITIGTSSTVEFNALKKNGIQVYPISAKQYVSGAWVDVTAKSYQGGEWVELYGGYLGYGINRLGEPSFVKISGGTSGAFATKTFTGNDDGTFTVSMKNTGDWMNGACCFPNKVSLSDATKITIKYVMQAYSFPEAVKVNLRVTATSGNSSAVSSVTLANEATEKNTLLTATLDVSGVSEGYLDLYHTFVNMTVGGSSFTMNIVDISPS